MRIGRFVKGQRVYYVRPLPAAPHRVELFKCTVTWTRGQKMTLAAVQMGQTIYRRSLVNDPVQPDGAQIWADLTEGEVYARAHQLGADAIEASIQRVAGRVAEMEAAAKSEAVMSTLVLDRRALDKLKRVKPHLEIFGMWIDDVSEDRMRELKKPRR